MHALGVWVAQYLLWLMVAGFAAVWAFGEQRRGKITLGASAIFGLVLALVFMLIASHVHHDPRPFVDNPNIKPWFAHSPDNGFPSDHSIAAGLIAALVTWRHRLGGLVFCAAAAAIAWARVAAHVHHLQDVLAGLLLGGVAAAIAVAIVSAFLTRRITSSAAPAHNEPPQH